MKYPDKISVFFLALLSGMLFCISVPAQTDRKAFQDGLIVFQLKEDASLEIGAEEKGKVDFMNVPFLAGVAKKYGITRVTQKHPKSGSPALKRTYEIAFTNLSAADELTRVLSGQDFILYAEKKKMNYVFTTTPNDPYLTNSDEWHLAKINAAAAWAITTGLSTVVVADVDNAFLTTHEDLKGKLSPLSWDVADGDADVNPPSNISGWLHGTNTAGIIGAVTNNGLGVASIGYNISVMAIKATTDTATKLESIQFGIEGVNYAADNGAKVISCSWGGQGFSNYENMVIQYAYSRGSLILASTGNSGVSDSTFPAAYAHVVGVGSSGQTDVMSSFSNYGPWVKLLAPGEDIWSSVTGGGTSGYAENMGTSQSCPIVAGTCGLMLSVNPGMNADQLMNCLLSTCDDISASNSGNSGNYGAGRLNAGNAVACAQSTASAAITSPSPDILSGVSGTGSAFSVSSANGGNSSASFTYTLVSYAPGDWKETFDVGNSLGNASTATVTIAGNTSMPVTIHVTPGATPKLGMFKLSMSVTGNPNSVNIATVYLLSGLTDLIVSNFNSSTVFNYPGYAVDSPAFTACNFVSPYVNGMVFANSENFDTTNQFIMTDALANGAMNGVKNIYFNVGWTFPAYTDAIAAQLTSFLNGGGNLLIAGQNIGWDIEAGVDFDGTTATKAFYSNYLNATFVNEGPATAGIIKSVTSDPVYGSAPASSQMDTTYGVKSISPDEVRVKNSSTGHSIFTYSADNTIGGVRTQTATYKVVYLGFGLEQLASSADANSIMKITYDYFHGITGTEDFDRNWQSMGQNYPNPSASSTVIPFTDLLSNAVLQVTDLTGRIVFSQNVPVGTRSLMLNTASLDNGMYMYRLLVGNTVSEARPMQVIH